MSSQASLTQKRKRLFDRHLLLSIDILAYSQLIIIYLHDISLLRFAMGAILQLTFLSPLVLDIQPQMNFDKRQIIISIIGYHGFCILMHILSDLPKPTSGLYLHGGLTIEFIGVRALESKIPLFTWDLIVLFLQLTAFSINFPVKVDRSGTTGGISSSSSSPSTSSTSPSPLPSEAVESNRPEEDDGTTPEHAIHPYSGQFLVRDISIFKSISDNWVQGRQLAEVAAATAAASARREAESTNAATDV